MQFHIINSSSGTVRVHKAGCRDVHRELRDANADWTYSVVDIPERTRYALMVDIWGDEAHNEGVAVEDPDHVASTDFLPCTGLDRFSAEPQDNAGVPLPSENGELSSVQDVWQHALADGDEAPLVDALRQMTTEQLTLIERAAAEVHEYATETRKARQG